jgi:hypothetical protein
MRTFVSWAYLGRLSMKSPCRNADFPGRLCLQVCRKVQVTSPCEPEWIVGSPKVGQPWGSGR